MNIHHDGLTVFPTRDAALSFIKRQPERTRGNMVTLHSGYCNGWIVEWHRSDGASRAACTDGRWHYIWTDECTSRCRAKCSPS